MSTINETINYPALQEVVRHLRADIQMQLFKAETTKDTSNIRELRRKLGVLSDVQRILEKGA